MLGSGPALHRRVTGAARAKAASALLATAKSSFDIVLIDSPGLLQVADAAEMVGASDAAIIVVGPDELTRDHVETVDRLKLIGSDVVGYIYDGVDGVPVSAPRARYQRNGSSARPTDLDPQPAQPTAHRLARRTRIPHSGTFRLSHSDDHMTMETLHPLN